MPVMRSIPSLGSLPQSNPPTQSRRLDPGPMNPDTVTCPCCSTAEGRRILHRAGEGYLPYADIFWTRFNFRGAGFTGWRCKLCGELCPINTDFSYLKPYLNYVDRIAAAAWILAQ